MIIFYALFMVGFFWALTATALATGNAGNKVGALCAAMTFWSACVFLLACAS